jgi:hypothetical protein
MKKSTSPFALAFFLAAVPSACGDGKMPPLASSILDREGLEAFSAWIRSLSGEKASPASRK